MNLDRVKELLDLMDKNNLTEIEIEEEGLKIRLQKGVKTVELAPLREASRPESPVPVEKARQQEISGDVIAAPMVGTFYRASSPEAAPFAGVGDTVTPDSVVCIIEAMKVMNEIKAGVSGKIAEILVENGHAVEFGQQLFRLEPAG